MPLGLNALRIFVDVMKHGSFAAVARQRDVDPSSVSRSISALEAELGVRLLQRTTRKLAPTEAGAEYFARVEEPLREVECAGQQALDLLGQPTGALRVRRPRLSVSACWLPCSRSCETGIHN